MTRKIANLALFQAGWFACVMGGNVIGAVVGSLILVIHFAFISRNPRELRLIGLGALIGCTFDQFLLLTGLLTTSQQGSAIPCWLIFLWLTFMTCIDHSMSWMKKSPAIASLCGAVFAPLSYYAGVRLGAIGFGHGVWSAVAVGVVWAIVMPLAIVLSTTIAAPPKTAEVPVK